MSRLEEALASLELSVDSLEDVAASRLAPTVRKRARASAPVGEDLGSLFSTDQLNHVKQRLDDAIERLESALEVADGAR